MPRIDTKIKLMDAQSQNPDTDNTADSPSAKTASTPAVVSSEDQLLSSYDYELPPERIAQTPLSQRDRSRLLVVSLNHHSDSIFSELPQQLKPGDLLILNNTRVIPARLYGHKPTGAPVELLLLEAQPDNSWLALVKPGRRLKPGAKIIFEAPSTTGDIPPLLPFSATILSRDEATGGRIIQFEVPPGASLEALLEQYGQVPLPPYITDSQALPEQYQTVYAQTAGAIAAPTAGLHFTPELLAQCSASGIEQAYITLHVGVGTFRPVEVDDVTTHKMHGEWLEVSAATVEKIRETKAAGGRVIAVGTTVVRALEAAAAGGKLQPYVGKTELFIYPGYQWRVVEGMITNFHLPRSSLMMLVSALIGRQRLLDLYNHAIASEYRFYSFGDAMLILPEARSVISC
ncbi:MAG: tRNA preQ1(34) S-adenosylmethionine ribosyltransferase-isomerase QueA [Coleofasciculaceae cyanobacterium]